MNPRDQQLGQFPKSEGLEFVQGNARWHRDVGRQSLVVDDPGTQRDPGRAASHQHKRPVISPKYQDSACQTANASTNLGNRSDLEAAA